MDSVCEHVLRAAYQISGLTGSAVSVEQVSRALPVGTGDVRDAIETLQSQSLLKPDAVGETIALTSAGIDAARRLPPVSEPPMFQDI